MKTFYLSGILSISLNLLSLGTHAQNWLWARSRTCPGNSSSEGWLIRNDNANHIFTAGINVSADICFDNFTFHNSPSNNQQAIIVKYDTSGNVMWAAASDSGNTVPIDLAVDDQGNVYLFGRFYQQSVRFGSYTVYNSSYGPLNSNSWGYYLVKYDVNGNVAWAKGSDNNVDFLLTNNISSGALAVDLNHNVYITAAYKDSAFRLGPHTLINSSGDGSLSDIFLAKYSPSGDALWAKNFGGLGAEFPYGLAFGVGNNLYLIGDYSTPSVIFGTDTLSYAGTYAPMGRAHFNAFVAKLDTSGNVSWARTATGNTGALSLAIDSEGNVLVGGRVYDSSVIFGADTLYNTHHTAGFLVKYGAEGGLIWDKSLNAVASPLLNEMACKIWSIKTDACNNIWISGNLNKDIQLDSTTILHAPPGAVEPMFLAAYDPNGILLDTLVLPTGGDDNSRLAMDNAGKIYLAGDYITDPFILGHDTLRMHTGEGENIFLARYQPPFICTPQQVRPLAPLSDITLYPNPATFTLTIQYTNPTQYTSASIYDITGRLMSSYPLTGNSTTISVQNIPPGIYQCRIMDGQQNMVTKKLVIMH